MNNLRNLRKQKNLTIVEVAEKIGVLKPTVLSWEHGTSQISMGKAKKLAEYFGVSVGYLLGLDTPTTASQRLSIKSTSGLSTKD